MVSDSNQREYTGRGRNAKVDDARPAAVVPWGFDIGIHFLPSESQKTPIAIVSNGMTPYRLHVHRRLVRELPQLKLFSVLTHDDATGKWNLADTTAIGVTHFGPGEPSALQSKPARAPHELAKAGRMIRFFRQQGVRAVVLIGYNDAGRFRIIRWCR